MEGEDEVEFEEFFRGDEKIEKVGDGEGEGIDDMEAGRGSGGAWRRWKDRGCVGGGGRIGMARDSNKKWGNDENGSELK